MRCLLGLAALLLAGCNVSVTNAVQVYQPLSGAVAVKLRIPVVANSIALFQVDDQTLAPDTQPTAAYTVIIDTTGFANGLHHLHVTIKDADAQVLQELDQTLLFQNDAAQ